MLCVIYFTGRALRPIILIGDEIQNKENNVFKDALGVKGLGFKYHGNHPSNHGSHYGNHHGNYHDNHCNHHGNYHAEQLGYT